MRRPLQMAGVAFVVGYEIALLLFAYRLHQLELAAQTPNNPAIPAASFQLGSHGSAKFQGNL